jgi:peptide/nickel transport system ATP-binding protein
VELLGTALAPSVGCGRSLETHLFEVRDLEVGISENSALPVQIPVLQAITFHVATGEIVGLLGESGAGKTTLALALLRLLPSSFRLAGGSIHFESRSLLSLSEHELRKTRGARISIIYQDSTVLNPVIRVGEQVVEVLRAHHDWSKQRCREEARSILNEVGIEDVDRIYASYPHQLSGGQRQRIVIAQALGCRPALVIADEPTSSLDPATAASIMQLLGRLNRQFKIAFLIISHDIEVLARLAHRVMVMYAGRIVEQGPCRQILHEPLHPYTRALLSCSLPDARRNSAAAAKPSLLTIAGSEAQDRRTSLRCNFESRCADRMLICAMKVPREFEAADAHTVSCFKYGNA